MSNITQELQTAKPAAKASRTALNFWVDLVTALLFALLLGTSFLMKFVLPPGTCDEDEIKEWLGHTRHYWGDIHFWAAVLMIILVIVHIWLHWDWVVKIWGKLLGTLKSPVSWIPLVLMVALLVLPFAIPAKTLDIPTHPDEHAEAASADGQVAPCGVSGLSCSDCPAADDRLFGGGCGSSDEEEAEEQQDASKEDEGTADEACGDESECSSCPSAGTGACPSELFGDGEEPVEEEADGQ